MRVKCVLCDKIESVDDESSVAKKLRNRPIHTYMCAPCQDRIAQRTKERASTGNFKLYQSRKVEEDW
ncbi:YlaI family protein [Metabacillus iocasae]|uniref:Uncharacterized protein YlaI n=1 Tax=Priestia iocasae TaxID=2291674 RepID=A0ABS2QV77_9BACI|nr:YlaI family protein [Metabacillus iocasae]MBM7703364.1 uncharacterized protein YlaI [Metabacillus iocasae]